MSIRTPEQLEAEFFATLERTRASAAQRDAAKASLLASPEGRERAAREAQATERQRVLKLRVRADETGCPAQPDVRAAAFAVDASGPAIDAVIEAIEWARGPGRNEYGRQPAVRTLLGERGVGKTVALVYALVRTHRTGHYVTADEMTRTHRAMHDNRAAWAAWTRCDLLCLDEAGIEEKPETISHMLLDRWAAGGITLVAGNVSRKAFIDRYLSGELGGRLLDRLGGQHEGGLVPSVVIAGNSRRPKPVTP